MSQWRTPTWWARLRVRVGLWMLGHVFTYAVILDDVDNPETIVAIVMATDKEQYRRFYELRG